MRLSRLIALLLGALAFARPAGAACESLHPKGELDRALSSVDASYGAMDLESFRAALDVAARMLPCMGEPLSPDVAAHYHRLQGLQAALVRDEERARLAFLAARRIDPAYRFPDEFIPESHPVRLQYAALPLEGIIYEDVPAFSGARTSWTLLIDGRKGDQRPKNTPTLVQILDETGQVQKTEYLWPGAPLPLPRPPEGPPAARRPLLWTAGGAALAAAGLTALAWQSSAVYYDDSTPTSDLEALRARTNISNGAALGLWAVAGGAAAGAIIVGRW